MAMQITSACFAACVTSKETLPAKSLPIIALVGRSNVGKSSLINVLTGRRELAKTSSTPGKTLTINFYRINDEFYIVDLPGYGYAKASKITRERIQKMMDEFFQSVSQLAGVIQILDVRHPPSTLDIHMNKWIAEQEFACFSVLTKVDKVSNSDSLKMKRQIQSLFRANTPVIFSAKTRQGRDELLNLIQDALNSLKPMKAKKKEPEEKQSPPKRRPENRGGRPEGGKQPEPSGGAKQGVRRPQEGQHQEKPPQPSRGRHFFRHRKKGEVDKNQPPRNKGPQNMERKDKPAENKNPGGKEK